MAPTKAPLHILIDAVTDAANDAEATVNKLTLELTEHSAEVAAFRRVLPRMSESAQEELLGIVRADGIAYQKRAEFQMRAFGRLQTYLGALLSQSAAGQDVVTIPSAIEDLIAPYLPMGVHSQSVDTSSNIFADMSPSLANIFSAQASKTKAI